MSNGPDHQRLPDVINAAVDEVAELEQFDVDGHIGGQRGFGLAQRRLHVGGESARVGVRLLDERQVPVSVDVVFIEGGEELELVPAEPDGDLLTPQVVDRLDPGRLERDLPHPAVLEDLGDVDERGALLPRREQARQPIDPELRPTPGHDLLGDDVRPARPDRQV